MSRGKIIVVCVKPPKPVRKILKMFVRSLIISARAPRAERIPRGAPFLSLIYLCVRVICGAKFYCC